MTTFTDPQPQRTIQIPWFFLAKVIWILCALLSFSLMVVSIWPRMQQLEIVSQGTSLKTGQLSQFEVETLEQWGFSISSYAIFFALLEGLTPLALFAIGGILFIKRSNERVAFFVSLGMVCFGLISSPLTTPLEKYPATAILLVGLRAIGLSGFILGFLLFPDGRFVPSWTKWLAGIWIVYTLLSLAFPGLRITASLVWEDAQQARMFVWALIWMMAIVVLQFYRYRFYSNPVERQQTKWVVYGLAFTLGLTTLLASALLLASLLDFQPSNILLLRLVAFTVTFPLNVLLAITFLIAILRSHLWDIDVLIRRTLVYGLLTGMLLLIYFASITLLQNLLSAVTRQQSTAAIVISTLAIAALFTPLRRRIQDTIDRRFYRRKYDAEKALAEFALTAREEVDLENLSLALLEVVDETIQPESASLWLREK